MREAISMSEDQAATAQPTPITPEASAPARPAPDLVQDLVVLREENRRWRLRFYAACAGFVFLLVVSLVQFTGTFVVCRMVHETRQEIDKLRSDGVLHELRKARETADVVSAKVKEVGILEREVLDARAEMEERSRIIDDHLARNGELGVRILELLRKADRTTIEEIDRFTAPPAQDTKRPSTCPDREK
jgi:hypothetical protein